MTDLPAFADIASAEQGLVVFTTLRRDGSAQASVVNAGVLPHPLTNEPVVGLVAIGSARKLGHLRSDPRTTVTARAGWRWATVEGSAQLIGPDDPHPDVDDERLRVMLREIFTAAGDGEAILARMRRFADAGVTDLSVRLLPIGDNRDELVASKRRTREVIAELGAQLR